MRPSMTVRGAGAALVMLVACGLAGCGDDAEHASDSAGAGAGASSGQDVDAKSDSDSDSDASDVDSDSDAHLTGAECLPGRWSLDNDTFKAMLESAGGNVRSVTGEAEVEYRTDGTSLATFDAWTTVAVDEHAKTTIRRNGQDQADYAVSGDTLTTTETVPGSVALMTVEMTGQPAITAETPHEEVSVTVSTFTCDGDTLTVVTDGATSILHRLP